MQSDDAFDAVIAALVARAFSVGEVEPIPPEDRGVALREGWIAVPYAGSLSLLARSAGDGDMNPTLQISVRNSSSRCTSSSGRARAGR